MLVRRGVVILSLGAILLVIALPHAASDGGFFWPGRAEVYQNAERVIFTVNGNGTITVVLGISYEGEAEEFSWVFPVPSVPELGVAETTSLETLELATMPHIDHYAHPCDHLQGLGPAGGDGPNVVAEGAVGPYDYAVLGANGDPDALATWLRENGYQISEEIEPVIADYVEEGMYFLAMRLRQDFTTQDIQPIVITYESDQVVFPIRLTAVAAVEDMPIKIWIFADRQYEPDNYTHPEPDYSRFRAASWVANIGYWTTSNNDATVYGFEEELERYRTLHDGQVFLTRFAGPSTTLLEKDQYAWYGSRITNMVREDAFLMDLIGRYPYLTYLWTRMSPDQMTVDPVFGPGGRDDDVGPIIELYSNTVNPFEYWGCSSAYALTDAQWANLPEASTYFPDLRLHLVHPADWVVSTIERDLPDYGFASEDEEDPPFYILAPQVVDHATLEAFYAGEPTPPMLVVVESAWYDPYMNHQWMYRQETFKQLLGLPRTGNPLPVEELYPIHARFRPLEPGVRYQGQTYLPVVLLGMLASEEDWRVDGSLYEVMLAYGRAFQFYVSPYLRHTLFLGDFTYEDLHYGTSVQVPYPPGWEIDYYRNRTEEIMIVPQRLMDKFHIPYVRLIPVEQVVPPIAYYEGDGILNTALEWVWDAYQLPKDEREEEWRQTLRCEGKALPFSVESPRARSGWVMLTDTYVIEFSSPPEYAAQYNTVLQLMAESTPPGISCE